MRVRAGQRFVYQPVGCDCWDARSTLRPGDVVQVVKLPGCPPPGTMGHCHVSHPDCPIALVLVNSLLPVEDKS